VAAEVYQRAIDVVKIENINSNCCIIHLPNFEITLVNECDKPLGMFKLVFGTESLEKVTDALTKGGISHQTEGERILADTLSDIGCALEFECIVQS
jgi:hypothetical protein